MRLRKPKEPPRIKDGTVVLLAGEPMRVVRWEWKRTGYSTIVLAAASPTTGPAPTEETT